MTVLSNHHELAQNVAAYLVRWNGAEALIAATLDYALGPGHGYAIVGPIQSINIRMDIVEAVLHLRKAQAPWMEEVVALIPTLRGANTYRNKLAHGLWMEKEGVDGLILSGNVIDSRRAFRQEVVTASSVQIAYSTLDQAVQRLTDILMSSQHPVIAPDGR